MDISDNFDPLQPQQQQTQQQEMHWEMQANGNAPASYGPEMHSAQQLPSSSVIALPPPPHMLPPFGATPSTSQGSTFNTQGEAQPQSSTTDVDIDSLLLQKFSCLGTTDHEDLISQFCSIMNNEVGRDMAKFFLEMSNWNLQAAVGCFLDFSSYKPTPLPSMKIVDHACPSETQQIWRLQNNGTEWPNGCYLMSLSESRRIEVPVIKPGETFYIVADIPPMHPEIVWHLNTPQGSCFGEPIRMSPPDRCSTQAELAEKMSQLIVSPNSTNAECLPQVNIVISLNME